MSYRTGPLQTFSVRNALEPELFRELAELVLPIPPGEQICDKSQTGWWDLRPPRSLVERVALALTEYVEPALRALRHHMRRSGRSVPSLAGAEWWVRAVESDEPHQWHIDKDEAAWNRPPDERELLVPVFGSVLYLSYTGGPTVIADQAPVVEGRDITGFDPPDESDPPIYAEAPEANKYIIFPGWARHGVGMASTPETRHTVLFNWWDRRPNELPAEPKLLPGETP